MFSCKLCDFKSTDKGKGRHLKFCHDMNIKIYYDLYEKEENEDICIICGKHTKFVNGVVGYRKYCCHLCSKQNISDETRQKISDASKGNINSKGHKHTAETKEKMSLAKRGKSTGSFTEERKQNISKALKSSQKMKDWGKWWSIQQRGPNNTRHRRSEEDWKKSYAKQSQTLKEKIAKGEFTPCVTNSWANSRCKIEIDGFERKYRSSWDAAFQILNPNCEYETLRVKYELEDTWHNYIVDFIDRINFYVYEIKPISESQSDINNIKRQALLKWCKENSFTYIEINDEWFNENANRIDFTKYDEKILNGMRQFL